MRGAHIEWCVAEERIGDGGRSRMGSDWCTLVPRGYFWHSTSACSAASQQSRSGRVYTSQTVSSLVPNSRVIFNIDYTFCVDVLYKKHDIRGSQHIGQRLSLNTQQPCTSQPPQRRISFDLCYHVSYYTIPSILSSTGTLGILDTAKLVHTNAGSNGTKCSTRQTCRNTTARVRNPNM